MKTDKTKKIAYYKPTIFVLVVIFLVTVIAIHDSIRRKNRHKRYFCVHETLNRIWSDQCNYNEKFKKYANFTDLVKFSQDGIVNALAKTTKNGIATRLGYNYCIYLLDKDTHSPIDFWHSRKGPKYNMVCYAWPETVSSGNVAFVIDSSGTYFEYYDSEGKYLGNNKPKFDDALLGVKNGLWFTAGADGDLAHENLKKQGVYSCDQVIFLQVYFYYL